MVNVIPDLHLTGDSQCFPFYTYNEDGTNRRENITDWALAEFRNRYSDDTITKVITVSLETVEIVSTLPTLAKL